MSNRKKNASEVEREYLEDLGPIFGPVYYKLYNEVVWVHVVWLEVLKLFGSKQNIDILNKYGSFIFKIIEDSLIDQILLHISRLTDPSKSRGNKNLSLKCLLDYVDSRIDKDILGKLINSAIKASQFARRHRNKRLAHKDLDLMLSKSKQLEPYDREDIENALNEIRSVMNYIENGYRNHTVMFENFIADEDSLDLIEALKNVKFDYAF